LLAVLANSADSQVSWVRSSDGQPHVILPLGGSKNYTGVWSPDGTLFGMVEFQPPSSGIIQLHELDWLTPSGWVTLWRTRDGQLMQRMSGHTRGADAVTFSADGQWLLSSGADHQIKLWRVAPRNPLWWLVLIVGLLGVGWGNWWWYRRSPPRAEAS